MSILQGRTGRGGAAFRPGVALLSKQSIQAVDHGPCVSDRLIDRTAPGDGPDGVDAAALAEHIFAACPVVEEFL